MLYEIRMLAEKRARIIEAYAQAFNAMDDVLEYAQPHITKEDFHAVTNNLTAKLKEINNG